MRRRIRFSMRTLLLIITVCGGAAYGSRHHVIAIWDNWTEPVPNFSSQDKPGAWDSVESMHAYYTQQFVESEGFGISRINNLQRFLPSPLAVNDRLHQIGPMMLIGLKDEPVIYNADWTAGILQQKKLGEYEQRSLNSAEQRAVTRMQMGSDYVWLPAKDKQAPVLFGALRATKSCVECHSVDEGTLLGAFAYYMLDQERTIGPSAHEAKTHEASVLN